MRHGHTSVAFHFSLSVHHKYNKQWAKSGLSGLLAPERCAVSAVRTALLLCMLQSLPHLAPCFGGLFAVKVSISPFSPTSGFSKMTLIIQVCTARKLRYVHTWYTCKFSLSDKYRIPVVNNVCGVQSRNLNWVCYALDEDNLFYKLVLLPAAEHIWHTKFWE